MPFYVYIIATVDTAMAIVLIYVLWRCARETFTLPPGYSIVDRQPMVAVYALGAFFFIGTDLLNFRNGSYENGGMLYLNFFVAGAGLLLFLLTLHKYRSALKR